MTEAAPTVAVLPIKRLADAKTRLAAELSAGPRQALAIAMFADVLTALREADRVSRVIVVSPDRQVRRIARGLGAEVLSDPESGHNAAAAVGIARANEEPIARVLLVPGDCPLVGPDELNALIARPHGPHSVVMVPDRHGTGTNALLLTPPCARIPSFGSGSMDRHVRLAERQGWTPEIVTVPGLALDVDTPQDLAALHEALAATRSGATHTRRVLTEFPNGSPALKDPACCATILARSYERDAD